MRLLDRILPPTALERTLVWQSILSAFASGSFLTGTAVFFTQIVGLSASQVGLGLSLAGGAALAMAIPTGKVADFFGAKRTWAVASLLEALLYLAYPVTRGFWAFVVLICVLAAAEGTARAGRGVYWIEIFPPDDRVRAAAFMRAARNIGYTLGAGAGGIALGIGTREAIVAVPLFTCALLMINALMISRLPALDHAPAPHVEEHHSVRGLRNLPFLTLSLANGFLQSNQVLLNVVVPLWLVERTDAPKVLLAWLFGTNTVLAVLLQVRAARVADSLPGALRAARLAGWAFVLSCVVLAITDSTVGWVSIILIWAGHVTITGAELWGSAASWAWIAELSDPLRRGEYQGVWSIGHNVERIVCPALYTWLALEWGTPGWAAIAAIAVTAVAITHPASRAAQRKLTLAAAPASYP